MAAMHVCTASGKLATVIHGATSLEGEGTRRWSPVNFGGKHCCVSEAGTRRWSPVNFGGKHCWVSEAGTRRWSPVKFGGKHCCVSEAVVKKHGSHLTPMRSTELQTPGSVWPQNLHQTVRP